MSMQRINRIHLCLFTLGLLLAGALSVMAQTAATSGAQRQDEDSAHQAVFHSRFEAVALQYDEHRDFDREEYRTAEQTGFEDGVNDGRRDRESKHSFRPTEDKNYKRADRGFSGGDKDHFRQLYREAYTRGYEEGYHQDRR